MKSVFNGQHSCQCSLSNTQVKNLFTADVGQGKVHIYDSGNDEFHPKLPEQNLIDLDIPKLESGDTLIVECAHLRESHRFTMAQPFDWEQLNNLKQNAEERGVTILLFPQKSCQWMPVKVEPEFAHWVFDFMPVCWPA